MTGCRICGSDKVGRAFQAREMMFGTRDEFAYQECTACDGLQIAVIPTELSKYYPGDYYAYRPAPSSRSARARLQDAVGRAGFSRRRHVARYYLNSRYFPGRLLERTYGARARSAVLPSWLRIPELKIGFHSRILDVGCGNGATLLELQAIGFSNLCGVDPFIAAGSHPRAGVTIIRGTVADVPGPFDLIMMHHSFEHMPDPAGVLALVHARLKPGGWALIRTPVAGSRAWERYGANWVQLDAPRHLHIVSPDGMSALSKRAGFRLASTVFDSTGFQFWGSEQYVRDVPLTDPRSFATGESGAIFSRAAVDAFDAEAAQLNAVGRGDQACFYLQRPAMHI